MPRRQTTEKNATLPQAGLTRQQRKAQTRALLIEIGKKHILRYGLGGAAADRISKEAGFTRGAFYLNFADIEDLFLAIVRQQEQQRFSLFQSILEEYREADDLLSKLRNALETRFTDPEWIVLHAEFEAGALRSEKLRQMYTGLYRTMLKDGRELLRKTLHIPGIQLTLKPNEFLIAILSLAHGMAISQRLLGEDLSQKSARKAIGAVFDRLLTTGEKSEKSGSPLR